MNIVICPTCLKKFNMDNCYVSGTCSCLPLNHDFCPYCCPHCHNIFYRHWLLSKQDELKEALNENGGTNE